MDELLGEFLSETHEGIELVDRDLLRLEREPGNKEIIAQVFRVLHTIKGTCGFVGLSRLGTVAHAAESLLDRIRDGVLAVDANVISLVFAAVDRIKTILSELSEGGSEPQGDDSQLIAALSGLSQSDAPPPPVAAVEPVRHRHDHRREDKAKAQPQASVHTPQQSIRVDVALIDKLMTAVHELVLTRNELMAKTHGEAQNDFRMSLQRLTSITAEIQDGVMRTRLQPISVAWRKLPRLVRDLSVELGKEIDLDMTGTGTELDRQVLERVSDPIMHLVRNAADHGLEPADVRRASGKPATGKIRLDAHHEGGCIVISIADDGAGLNTAAIKQKALTMGLVSDDGVGRLSDAQIHHFIFSPGFSTARSVTAVSGRGVGLDVVRTNVLDIGGTIDLRSTPGAGTCVTIKIPLTLAILSTLIVGVAGGRYALPQTNVVEIVRTGTGTQHRIERVGNAAVLRLRGQLIPIVDLGTLLGHASEREKEGDLLLVVVKVGNLLFGASVDAVFDIQEIVIKPLSSELRQLALFSGATILGDGSVIMIVDPQGLAAAVGTTGVDSDEADVAARAQEEKQRSSVPLLIFQAGAGAPKAIPLSVVERLEFIDKANVESVSGRHVVQYRGSLMPLIGADNGVRIGVAERQPVLVVAEGERYLGLAVDAFLDIVDEPFELKIMASRAGFLGTTVLAGKATEIIDLGQFIKQFDERWQKPQGNTPQSTRTRILLLDESSYFRMLIAPLLTAAGYRVVTAQSVEDVHTLKEEGYAFDLIIGSASDGSPLHAMMETDPHWREVPQLILSDDTSSRDAEPGASAADADASDFDGAEILKMVSERLRNRMRAA